MDMKKVLGIGIILLVMLLSACGNDEEVNTEPKEEQEPSAEQENNEPSQDELDEQLKEEATEADFVKVNGDEVDEGTKLYAEGETSNINDDTLQGFTLTTDGGMYTVKSFSDEDVSEGDQVKVYGTYDGKDDTSMPILNVTVIETTE